MPTIVPGIAGPTGPGGPAGAWGSVNRIQHYKIYQPQIMISCIRDQNINITLRQYYYGLNDRTDIKGYRRYNGPLVSHL